LNLLERAIKDEAWEVRESAAWALSRMGGSRSTRLLEQMRSDSHERVRGRVRWALEMRIGS